MGQCVIVKVKHLKYHVFVTGVAYLVEEKNESRRLIREKCISSVNKTRRRRFLMRFVNEGGGEPDKTKQQ